MKLLCEHLEKVLDYNPENDVPPPEKESESEKSKKNKDKKKKG